MKAIFVFLPKMDGKITVGHTNSCDCGSLEIADRPGLYYFVFICLMERESIYTRCEYKLI